MFSLKSLKSKGREEKEKLRKRKCTFGICLISRSTPFREELGSGFLVENLVVREGNPPLHYLVTSNKVIKDFGERMKNYVLQFRESVKSPKKFIEIPLHEIAASLQPYKPHGDTSGIIFICLNSESKKFHKVLKGRLFSVVEEDSQTEENVFYVFVDIYSHDFVKGLRIIQIGSGECVVEESGGSYTTFEALLNNPGHRPLGGAILKEVQGEFRCAGMLDFTEGETRTPSPVFFSSIFPRKDERGARGEHQPPVESKADRGESPSVEQVEGGVEQTPGEQVEGGEEQPQGGQVGGGEGPPCPPCPLLSLVRAPLLSHVPPYLPPLSPLSPLSQGGQGGQGGEISRLVGGGEEQPQGEQVEGGEEHPQGGQVGGGEEQIQGEHVEGGEEQTPGERAEGGEVPTGRGIGKLRVHTGQLINEKFKREREREWCQFPHLQPGAELLRNQRDGGGQLFYLKKSEHKWKGEIRPGEGKEINDFEILWNNNETKFEVNLKDSEQQGGQDVNDQRNRNAQQEPLSGGSGENSSSFPPGRSLVSVFGNNRSEGHGAGNRTNDSEKRKSHSVNKDNSAGSESTPYFWQFKEEDSYSWRTFGPSDNVALEELYCDVDNLEVNVNLQDTALSIFIKSASQMSVNFKEMSMHSPSSAQFLLRRCSTPSYVHEPNNKSSTQWVWYWKDNDGWKKYGETIQSSGTKQEKIEAAYLNDERTYSFRNGSHNYILKFCETPMYQMNTDPHLLTQRQVRRRPLFASKSASQDTKRYPRGEAKDFQRTCLEKDCKEYRTVSQRFHESLPEHKASILMVEKIRNDELRERYESKRERLKRKLTLRGHDEIEKLLFHGTASDVVDAICKHNFDHRLRGKNGTQFGEGSYFAVNASYSNNYSSDDGKKTRYMFLASVLTGESKLGRGNLRRPPLQDPSNLTSDLYDSCVDDENQPKIYVIFNDEQCYPSYLIKYILK